MQTTSLPIGSFVLALMPIWLTVILLLYLTRGMFQAFQLGFNWFAHEVSWASLFGDIALLGSVVMSSEILHRDLPGATWYGHWQFAIGIICVIYLLVVLAVEIVSCSNFVSDAYHNVVTVPLYIYLVVGVSAPTVYLCGSLSEKCSFLGLIVFWLICLIADAFRGALHQYAFIRDHYRDWFNWMDSLASHHGG